MLAQEAITEYKEIYLKKYNILLSDQEAATRANALVRLYSIVYGKHSLSKQNNVCEQELLVTLPHKK